MSPSVLDRRAFLSSGIALAGATLLGASANACSPEHPLAPPTPGAPRPDRAEPPPSAPNDLQEPRVIASVGGLLSASIVASTNPAKVAGRTVREPVTYDGTIPGPTLWAHPGDTLDVTFTNRIVFDQADTKPGYGRPPRATNATNLHFHGMHVSPVGRADNMLVSLTPNESFRYLVEIPRDHPAGLFWYHAHVHGLVTNHVGRGAAGMIYVANGYTDRVMQLGIRHRLMALQQAYFEPDGATLTADDANRDDPDLALSLINGQLMPDICMRPGEPQVWSLLNASTSAFYALRLEGHTFDVVAEDGVPLASARTGRPTLVLASGQRVEVVVRASTSAGRYALSYDAYDQGVDTWPRKAVGTVVVDGATWAGPSFPGVDPLVALEDLRKGSPAERRTIVFGVDRSVPEGEFGRFTINGRAWDPAFNAWTSTLGAVEEWEIVNETEQEHPFHVHVNPFQVTRVNGRSVGFDGYRDVAIIPRFGSLTVRTRFTDFPGAPILIHCHILDHEDMGMMTRFTIASARV